MFTIPNFPLTMVLRIIKRHSEHIKVAGVSFTPVKIAMEYYLMGRDYWNESCSNYGFIQVGYDLQAQIKHFRMRLNNYCCLLWMLMKT